MASTVVLATIAFSSFIAAFFLKLAIQLAYSPLNRFPGPLLARTIWYKAYYDLVQNGGWANHLQTLHAHYGPIVRVGPNELHFGDPSAYGEIYSPGSRFHKDHVLYNTFQAGGTTTSIFTALDPRQAAVVRNLVAPYFSRHAVIQRQDVVREKVLKLVSLLASFNPDSGRSADLQHAFVSTSLDTLTAFIFSKSYDVLDTPGFHHPFVRGSGKVPPPLLNIWLFKYLPDRNFPLLGLLSRLMLSLNPLVGAIEVQRKMIQAEAVLALSLDEKHNDEELAGSSSVLSFLVQKIQARSQTPDASKRFQHLLALKRLTSEGVNLRFAGVDTVANACLVGIKYLLTQKEDQERLVKELDNAWPAHEEMSLEELEKLPFLTAVIKESLRLSQGVLTPLGRTVGPEDAVILGETIPAGTTIGISATLVHLNAEIFPKPLKFLPERWLKSITHGNELSEDSSTAKINSDKYLVSFSRGPRSCLGIHLAWCELYYIFGFLFRKLDLVAASDPNEPLQFYDFFTPMYRGNPILVHAKKRVFENQ